MAEQISSLRQATNYINIVGKLKECNLKKANKDNNDYISGDVIVEVAEGEVYKVGFYSNRLTQNKTESKIYSGYETFMENAISEAKALQENLPLDQVSKIKINGSLAVNDFYNAESDKIITTPQLRGKFIHRIKETEPYEPSATFGAELYFENMEKEITEDAQGNKNETGRLKIDGIIPIYQGQVIPITFYTSTDNKYVNVSEYLFNHYETGKSSYVWGKLHSLVETKTYVKESFGAPPSEKTFTNYHFELLIDNGNPEQYLITDIKNFDKSTIKSAMLYREEQLEKKKTSNSTPTNGFGSMPTNTVNTSPATTDDDKFAEFEF